MESVLVECDHCGEVKLCVLAADPFTSEVYPEDDAGDATSGDATYWCDDCYSNRHAEV